MIRINLLAAERERTKKKAVTFGTAGQKMAVGCSMILILALLFIGWRYWVISRDSNQLDAAISTAQQETTRLHSVIQQVQQFEQRKAQLQQRRRKPADKRAAKPFKGRLGSPRYGSVNQMQLTLTKLPWYAQVGAFVVLALVGCGVFYYYYEMPVRADMTSREQQLTALKGD